MFTFFFNVTATTEIYTYDTLFPYTTLFRSWRRFGLAVNALSLCRRRGNTNQWLDLRTLGLADQIYWKHTATRDDQIIFRKRRQQIARGPRVRTRAGCEPWKATTDVAYVGNIEVEQLQPIVEAASAADARACRRHTREEERRG